MRLIEIGQRRTIRAITVGVGLLAACGTTTNADPEYRLAILARVDAAQATRDTLLAQLQSGREPDSALLTRIDRVDSVNGVWIRETIRRGGWPRRAAVGDEGVNGAFFLVQNAPSDGDFPSSVVPLLKTAAGREDARGEQYAFMADRAAREAHRGQRFGPQLEHESDKSYRLAPLEDSIGVASRRSMLGLPPLELRSELLAHVKTDQAIRDTLVRALQGGQEPDSAFAVRMDRIDSVNTRWIRTIIHQYGWPTIIAVGSDGENAAFLLVQHATDDSAFMAAALPLLDSASQRGAARRDHYALLFDRVAVQAHRPQRFGTQAEIMGGPLHFDPIEDSVHVDARRARVGLGPLADYAKMLASMYGAAPPAARPR